MMFANPKVVDPAVLHGNGLHRQMTLTAAKLKHFPHAMTIEGVGNGFNFERIKKAKDWEGKEYAFYRQFMGMMTITVYR